MNEIFVDPLTGKMYATAVLVDGPYDGDRWPIVEDSEGDDGEKVWILVRPSTDGQDIKCPRRDTVPKIHPGWRAVGYYTLGGTRKTYIWHSKTLGPNTDVEAPLVA